MRDPGEMLMITVRRGLFASFVTIAAATTAVSSSPAAFGAGIQAFVEIKGQRQGQFKAESTQKDRANKWIDVLAFKAGESTTYDSSSGQASGRRKHDPVCFTKHWGAASPQIFTAVSSNEVLPEVQFDFVRTDGGQSVFETIKLTNAGIIQARQQLGVDGEAPGRTMDPFEEVCFTFQKIEITNVEAHTASQDNWM
jgi:type VI secretion system secreted protein Hcp